jgi:hypothetical protein
MPSILDKIPEMKVAETVSLWRNALGTLENQARASQHFLAQKVIEAVGAEWERRRRNPVNPEDMFPWPSTEATGGSGNLDGADWLKEGVLKFMGYRVGITGEPRAIRKRILSEIFSGPLPPAFPESYLNEWADRCSAPRLKKMAEAICWRNHPAHTAHKNRFGRKVRQMIYNYIQRYPELRDFPLESPTDLSNVAEVVGSRMRS